MPVLVADVKQRVADALKLASPDDLAPWWTGVCTSGLASAGTDVRGVLLARGFTVAQLTDWPDLDSYVSDQAVYWSAVNGGMLEAFDSKFMEKLEKRFETLKTVAVTDLGGALVSSAAIGHGPLKTKVDVDTFVDAEGKFRKW